MISQNRDCLVERNSSYYRIIIIFIGRIRWLRLCVVSIVIFRIRGWLLTTNKTSQKMLYQLKTFRDFFLHTEKSHSLQWSCNLEPHVVWKTNVARVSLEKPFIWGVFYRVEISVGTKVHNQGKVCKKNTKSLWKKKRKIYFFAHKTAHKLAYP